MQKRCGVVNLNGGEPFLLKQYLSLDAIRVQVEAPDWRAAIAAAGQLLVDRGQAKPAYVQAMIRAVETLGPYIVLTPGVALAHARPSSDVIKPGVSLITLRAPVNFGSAANDPVDLVFAFSAVDAQSHLATLRQVAGLLDRPEALEGIRRAAKPADVLHWL